MKKWILIISFVCGFFPYMLSSCGGAFLNSTNLFSSLPDADGESRQIPNNEFFYVNISNSFYRGQHGFDLLDYEMYELKSGPGYDCKISKNEESSTEDMYCMFDILEGDLFLHDLVFEYNTPPGMCDYLSFQTHWHYNQPSGKGPTEVFTRTKFEMVSRYCPSDFTDGNACTDACKESQEDGLSFVSCLKESGVEYIIGPNRKIKFCADDSEAQAYNLCSHNDYSDCVDEEEEGKQKRVPCFYGKGTDRIVRSSVKEHLCEFNDAPDNENCCVGEYKIYNRANAGEKKPSEGSWGGDLRKCIGGLGRVSWDNYTKDGLPAILIRRTLDGLRDTYRIPAIIKVLDRKEKINGLKTEKNSFVTANYWEGVTDNSESPSFYESVSEKGTPDFHERIGDGYPYITFSCEDRAEEVKHRIHLIIREWNSVEEFMDFKDSQGDNGDPDVVGASGSDCDYYEDDNDNVRAGESKCNDMDDVDDWMDTDESHPELEYKESG